MNYSFTKDYNNIVYLNGKVVYIPYKLIKNKIINSFSHKDFFNLCSFFETFLIDRTKTLTQDIVILDKIPYKSDYNHSFEKVVNISAKQIVLKALNDNKKIELLWSGGIDSTTALIAIYQELKKVQQLDNLTIVLSKESIDEFNIFFTKFIKKNLNYIIFTPPIFTSLDPNKLIITGELGDQIFGGNTTYNYLLSRKDIFNSYDNLLELILYEKFKDKKTIQNIISYINPFIKKAPFKLNTLYDVLWWFDFAGKWQFVQFNLISKTYQEGELKFKLNDNIIHFFNHIEFQKWAIQNRKKQTEYTPYTYKLQAKEYIYKFFPNKTYLLKKQKERSLKKIICNNQFPFSI